MRYGRIGNDNIWVGTNDGVLRWSTKDARFDHFQFGESLQGRNVLSLVEDSSGQIWAGTFEGGLVRLDPLDGSITRFRHDSEDPLSISSNDVRAVFEDDESRLVGWHCQRSQSL